MLFRMFCSCLSWRNSILPILMLILLEWASVLWFQVSCLWFKVWSTRLWWEWSKWMIIGIGNYNCVTQPDGSVQPDYIAPRFPVWTFFLIVFAWTVFATVCFGLLYIKGAHKSLVFHYYNSFFKCRCCCRWWLCCCYCCGCWWCYCCHCCCYCYSLLQQINGGRTSWRNTVEQTSIDV